MATQESAFVEFYMKYSGVVLVAVMLVICFWPWSSGKPVPLWVREHQVREDLNKIAGDQFKKEAEARRNPSPRLVFEDLQRRPTVREEEHHSMTNLTDSQRDASEFARMRRSKGF